MLELPALEPETTALLIVDVQDKLLPAIHPPHARRMLACIELLAEAAYRMHMAIFVTEQYPAGLGPTVEPLRSLLASFEPPPVRSEKVAFTAFADKAVSTPLTARGAYKAVIVVGVEAHVCVYQTARDLRRAGLATHVPFDAVASREAACRDTALALLARAGVAVTTSETLLFDLLRTSANPHFKPLSAKIKALPPV